MLRLIHNQTVAGGILINDIDDGLPNKTAKRGVARGKISGDLPTITQAGVGDTLKGPLPATSGTSLTYLSGVVTLVDSAGTPFGAGDVGKRITIVDAVFPGNNGTFVITTVVGSNTLTYSNSGGHNTSAFTYQSNDVSLVDAGGSFISQNVGASIVISGATNPTNDGTFTIEKLENSNTIIFVNIAGVTETHSFIYSILGGIADSDSYQRDGNSLGGVDKSTSPDINYPKQKCYIPKFKILRLNPITYDTTVPGYIDVSESDRVLMSQNEGVIYGLSKAGDLVGVGNLTFGSPTVTLTDAGATFAASDLGKQVEIIDATNPTNNGSFKITLVVSATQIQYTNLLAIAESSVNYEIARGPSLITVVSFDPAVDVTPPKITAAIMDDPTAGVLRVTGLNLTSLEPDVTKVTIFGATTVTVTQAQIIAAGGNISATQIDVPATLLPVVTVGSTIVSVSADGQSTSATLLLTTGWTSTGWAGTYNAFKHNTGNTTPLTNTLAGVVGVIYTVTITITARLAGTVTGTFGGITGSAISATTSTSITATSTGALSIVPSTDFDGTVAVSIKATAAKLTSLLAAPTVATAVLRRGTGKALTFSTPTVTLVDAAATFVVGDVGKSIKISGASTPGNNGTFVIATAGVPTADTLTYTNAAGATEAANYVLELGITGTALTSTPPDVTSVIITGAGAETLTAAQITTGGGSVGATSIIVPVPLIPSVAPTTSSVQVSAHNQLSTVVAVT